MIRKVAISGLLSLSFAASAETSDKQKFIEQYVSSTCLLDFDMEDVQDKSIAEILPTVIEKFLPATMKYYRISDYKVRIEGHGGQCAEQANGFLVNPSQWGGLKIIKVVSPNVQPIR